MFHVKLIVLKTWIIVWLLSQQCWEIMLCPLKLLLVRCCDVPFFHNSSRCDLTSGILLLPLHKNIQTLGIFLSSPTISVYLYLYMIVYNTGYIYAILVQISVFHCLPFRNPNYTLLRKSKNWPWRYFFPLKIFRFKQKRIPNLLNKVWILNPWTRAKVLNHEEIQVISQNTIYISKHVKVRICHKYTVKYICKSTYITGMLVHIKKLVTSFMHFNIKSKSPPILSIDVAQPLNSHNISLVKYIIAQYCREIFSNLYCHMITMTNIPKRPKIELQSDKTFRHRNSSLEILWKNKRQESTRI